MTVKFTYSTMGEDINGYIYRTEYSFTEEYKDTDFNREYFAGQAAHDEITLNPYVEDYSGILLSIRQVRIVG